MPRIVWLFDVGEDAQRALLRREHLKPSKVWGDLWIVMHVLCMCGQLRLLH